MNSEQFLLASQWVSQVVWAFVYCCLFQQPHFVQNAGLNRILFDVVFPSAAKKFADLQPKKEKKEKDKKPKQEAKPEKKKEEKKPAPAEEEEEEAPKPKAKDPFAVLPKR